MVNNTDIVKEIEEMLELQHFEYVRRYEASKLLELLQRARDALRWIPCEERLPEKDGLYEVWTKSGGCHVVYFINGTWPTLQSDYIQAWRPVFPYTPEEK